MAIPSKDSIEFTKLSLELPKFGLQAAFFLATAAAFILREPLNASNQWVAYTVGALYFVGVLLTIGMYLNCYNFVSGVFVLMREYSVDDKYENDIKDTFKSKYPFMSALTRGVIGYWVVIMLILVVASVTS